MNNWRLIAAHSGVPMNMIPYSPFPTVAVLESAVCLVNRKSRVFARRRRTWVGVARNINEDTYMNGKVLHRSFLANKDEFCILCMQNGCASVMVKNSNNP